MSQPTLNTTPLFQTSLRNWQASWKARRSQAENGSPSDPASPEMPRGHRPGRFRRRPRPQSLHRPRA